MRRSLSTFSCDISRPVSRLPGGSGTVGRGVLAPGGDEADAAALVLEAGEVLPAAVLALVPGGGEALGVVNGDVSAEDREESYCRVRRAGSGNLTDDKGTHLVLPRAIVGFDVEESPNHGQSGGQLDPYRRSVARHVEACHPSGQEDVA